MPGLFDCFIPRRSRTTRRALPAYRDLSASAPPGYHGEGDFPSPPTYERPLSYEETLVAVRNAMLGELDRLRDDFAVEFSAELEDPLPRKGQSKALDAVRAKRLAWRDARFIEYHERLSRTYTAIHDRDEAFITYDVQTLEAVSDRFEEIADLWQHYRDENEAQRHRGNPNRGF